VSGIPEEPHSPQMTTSPDSPRPEVKKTDETLTESFKEKLSLSFEKIKEMGEEVMKKVEGITSYVHEKNAETKDIIEEKVHEAEEKMEEAGETQTAMEEMREREREREKESAEELKKKC